MTKGPAILSRKLWFPPAEEAGHEGLIAIGGDLGTDRLLMAYRKGIFPWYDGSIPLWWCPDPRFVLDPRDIIVSKSMRQIIKKQVFDCTCNEAFAMVITHCKTTHRPGQHGTWLSDEMQEAYTRLHHMGFARSYEAWHNEELVGGLYGIKIGNIFFGESMFSHQSNASKTAFIYAVEQLQNEGVVLIDCQVHTHHLESLGSKFISRRLFLNILDKEIGDVKRQS